MIELTPDEERCILLRRLHSTLIWGVICQKAAEAGAKKIEVDKIDTHLWRVVVITEPNRYMAMGNDFPDALIKAITRFTTDKKECQTCSGEGSRKAFLSGREFRCPHCKGSGKDPEG